MRSETCLLVVTYNRLECLKRLVAAARENAAGADLLVVDNASTDGTGAWLAAEGIDTLSMPRNTGGAGGFAAGIAEAARRGWRYVWMMDDDVLPLPGGLEALLEYAKRFDAVQPTKLDSQGRIWEFEGIVHEKSLRRSRILYAKAFRERDAVPCNATCFEGLFMKTALAEKAGLPDAEFFIGFDDIHYGMRLARVAKLVYVKTPCLQKQFDKEAFKVGGKRLFSSSATSRRYHLRNFRRVIAMEGLGARAWAQYAYEWTKAMLLNIAVRSSEFGVRSCRSAEPTSQSATPNSELRTPNFTLVTVTMGREAELARLKASLAGQTYRNFEHIVIDQRVEKSTRGSLSAARNLALERATGDIVAFPDDDAWYQPDTLARAAAILADPEVDGVSFRVTDEHGRPSAGGWMSPEKKPMAKGSIWHTAVSCSFFVKREKLGDVRFDETLGAGSGTRFGSGEETDFILRLMERGVRFVYDGTHIVGHPQAAAKSLGPRRGWLYGNGCGLVLRRHGFGFGRLAWMVASQCVRAVQALATLKFRKCAFHLAMAAGRACGYAARAKLKTEI